MYMIEVDIEPNSNIEEEEIHNFVGTKAPQKISKVIYFDDVTQSEFIVDIVGWEDGAPIPAHCIQVEDSNDGIAWLIYGGNHGIRMREAKETPISFSLENSEEWGETYLYYHSSLFDRYIKPFI